MMTRIEIKRVYEPAVPGDGYRVFVDKLWPRGMRRNALVYDLWAKDLAPSDALRRWYHAASEERWSEFQKKYAGELSGSPALAGFVRRVAGKPVVTLLYGAKNTAENHALILQELLQKALVGQVSGSTTG